MWQTSKTGNTGDGDRTFLRSDTHLRGGWLRVTATPVEPTGPEDPMFLKDQSRRNRRFQLRHCAAAGR